jgi:hypothetical protein
MAQVRVKYIQITNANIGVKKKLFDGMRFLLKIFF